MAGGGRAAHDRRALRGQLTTRLVTQESMSRALNTLLADTRRYVIAVSRPRYSWRSGKPQEAAIVIYDGDPLALDQLDQRLRHSRRVIILITQDDGGVAKVDLTSRRWESWNKTASLTERMLSVNQRLLDGACTRAIGVLPATLILLAPLWLAFVSFFAWGFSSRSARQQVFAKGSINFVAPHWFGKYISILFHLWPIFVLLAVAVLLVDIMSGGLSVWPDELSSRSIRKTIHGIQANLLGAKSVSGMLSGIAIGISVAYILSWFTH